MQSVKVIGNNPQSDFIISGKFISDKHALLIEADGKVYIQDLGSTFGTHVNGRQVTEKTELHKKDRVKLGTQLFHWQDLLSDASNQSDTNPIFIKHLFLPQGTLTWNDYKFVLILTLGAIIVIPFGIPTVLTLGKYHFTRYNRALREEIDIWPYVEPLILLFGIICLYIFLNLTQKMIRGIIKKNHNIG